MCHKDLCKDLDRACTEFINQCWKNWHLYNIKFSDLCTKFISIYFSCLKFISLYVYEFLQKECIFLILSIVLNIFVRINYVFYKFNFLIFMADIEIYYDFYLITLLNSLKTKILSVGSFEYFLSKFFFNFCNMTFPYWFLCFFFLALPQLLKPSL